MSIVLGQVVYSKAGRDQGKVFTVIEILDQDYVFVSDGDLRRVESPKKKKLKHLTVTPFVLEVVSQKLTAEYRLTNADVRKAIAEFKKSLVDVDSL